MLYPISMIPYGNMAPYRRLGTPAGTVFVPEHPRRAVDSLKSGAVLASCAPVGGLPDLGDRVEFIGRFGIAAAGAVRSVLLLSRVPWDQLGVGHSIWVTDQTASSVRLLWVLLSRRQEADSLPVRAAAPNAASARLLIGDDALVAHARDGWVGAERYPFIIDLAAEWYALYRLPFVFARWVVRRDAPPEVKQALRAWLEEFRRREAELVAAIVPQEAARLGLTEPLTAAYHHAIRRVFGPDDERGQETFLAEWRRCEPRLSPRQTEEVPR